MNPAFLNPYPLLPVSCTSMCTTHRRITHFSPSMTLQRPDSDGPPSLDDYITAQRAGGLNIAGPPVSIGTGRGLLETSGGSVKTAVETALRKVNDSIGGPIDLLHVTCSPSLDISEVQNIIFNVGTRVGTMGRVVSKKGHESGVVEILGMRSGAEGGVGFGEGIFPHHSFESGVRNLIQSVATKLGEKKKTFWIFSHELDVEDAAIRRLVEEEDRGGIAYGGRAVGGGLICQSQTISDGVGRVQVAAISGSVNFLQSAVVKSWTQPAYVERLDFMTPKYTGNAEADLLTAIRFNDWEKFIECMEVKKVPVNYKWVAKQSQIPLLAACARGRLKMVQYLLDRGADVEYRNDGGFNAKMYTLKLEDYGKDLVYKQLDMLRKAGADVTLTEEEKRRLDASSSTG